MKLVLIFFALILMAVLIFGRTPPGSASPAPTAQPTAIHTLTPTVSAAPPTGNIGSPDIYYYLNTAIENMESSTKFSQLEHIYGASYQVVYAGFQQENGIPTTFQVHTRCECAGNGPCCNPMHTFVITMQAMDDVNYESMIVAAVPTSVRNLEVLTFDHTNSDDSMIMPWLEVVSFLQGNLDGIRLWSQVTPVPN